MDFTSVPFPAELNAYRPILEPYLHAKLRQYGSIIIRGLNLNITNEQVKHVLDDALAAMAQQDAAAAPQRPLRLVIRHDCQSTGCGNMGCYLCQYNPSRLCTRNVKQKYLIDDHLKAKCGAPLRVELVDDTGACATEGLPPGVQLEVHVLNGEKYKELCPDNTLLSIPAVKNCIISHHTKALLRREGMSEDALRVFLQLERGSATLSDLTLTTSSEALLSGKAPTFRLLVWAVEANGEPVQHVTYVVSESFVVATKRVKHAIKSDIPSVADHISKLQHIGKATVEKLMDLRQAFQEEGFDVRLPEKLIRVEKVGQFRELVEMSELNNDLKNKLRHVLKLSPDKWDEVCQHALSAVVPDFRNRVWWCPPLRLGLLYACKNGAIAMDNPLGVIRLGPTADAPRTVVPLQNLSPADFQAIPRLKQQAVQSWYMANHPNWEIVRDGNEDAAAALPPPAAAAPPPPTANSPPTAAPAAAGGNPMLGQLGPGMVPSQPPPPQQPQQAPALVPVGLGPGAPGAYAGELYGGPAGVPYIQADGGAYGAPGGGPPGLQGALLPPVAGLPHRPSNSSPFAMLQQQPAQPHPQQPPQPVPVQVKQQQPAQPGPGPGVVPGASREQQQPPGPSVGVGVGPSGSGGLMPAAALSVPSGALSQGSGPAPSGGSGNSANRGSVFAANMMMMSNIADAFPKFPGGPGVPPTGPHAAAGGDDPRGVAGPSGGGAADGGLHAQGPGSEVLEQMLAEGGMSLFNVNTLTANDTTDWLAQLHGAGGSLMHGSLQQGLPGANSYTMLDVGPPPHDGGGGALLGAVAVEGAQGQGQGPDGQSGGGAAAAAGGHGGMMDPERRLSLKLNSMSLDLGDFAT